MSGLDPADAQFGSPRMAALFTGEAHVGAMLRFEAALARAEARAGVIPPEAADGIEAACRVELFDIPALYRDAVPAGTPAIPLVTQLQARAGDQAARYVHWGATSQDAIDTALMLQAREGLDLLADGLAAVGAACASLAEEHRATPMAGRTLLQQALPVTFGLKAARWLALVTRTARRLRDVRERALAVQLGGAAGTLASLGGDGLPVLALLAGELDLPAPDLPWHAERDRVVELASALGIAAGAMGKIAADLVLLAQTEVGEVTEGAAPGKGGSSTLPQKRNPVDATFALASARLAAGVMPLFFGGMAHEHERAVGAWQAEWDALPRLFTSTAGAVERVAAALDGLEVHADAMGANLDRTGGLLLAEALSTALAPHTGRPEAQRLVQAASKRAIEEGRTLEDVARADEGISAVLDPAAIHAALEPTAYLGSTDAFIDRALAGWNALGGESVPSGSPATWPAR